MSALNPLACKIESLLFLSNQPVTEMALAEACEVDLELIEEAVAELEADLVPGRRGLILRRVGGGLRQGHGAHGRSVPGRRPMLSNPRSNARAGGVARRVGERRAALGRAVPPGVTRCSPSDGSHSPVVDVRARRTEKIAKMSRDDRSRP